VQSPRAASAAMRCFVSGAAGVLFIGVPFAALVPAAGTLQHIWSKPTAVSAGVQFDVPPRYWVSGSKDGPATLWQFGFGVPLIKGSYGFIDIFPHTGMRRLDLGSDLNRFRLIEMAQQRSAGFVFREERSFVTRAAPAVCLAFSNGSKAAATCFFFEGPHLALRFDGDLDRLADEYSIVSSARPL
jgi:hypothetical protein